MLKRKRFFKAAPLKKMTVFADVKGLLAIKRKVRGLLLPASRRPAFWGKGATVSPFRTRGLDFQEVRVYQPGDDIRQIDWRVTAKHGKPFTKLYTDEKERDIFIVCDMRTSMKFGSKGEFKSVLVARVAAFLSFLALQKKDRVGFTIISSDGLETTSPDAGEETVISFIQALSDASDPKDVSPDTVSLADALKESISFLRRGALVFILSDFADLAPETKHVFARVAAHRTVHLMHVYDPLEVDLPSAVFPITDGQKTAFLDITKHKKAYQSGFSKNQTALINAAKQYGLGYLTLATDEPDLERMAGYVQGMFK